MVRKEGGESEINRMAIVLPDDDTLVFTVDHHISVHVVCQSIDVRRILILSLTVDKRQGKQISM